MIQLKSLKKFLKRNIYQNQMDFKSKFLNISKKKENILFSSHNFMDKTKMVEYALNLPKSEGAKRLHMYVQKNLCLE